MSNDFQKPRTQTYQIFPGNVIQPSIKTSQKDVLYTHLCHYITANYSIYQNRHRTKIFVERATGRAIFPDDEGFKDKLKNIFAQTTGKEPPEQTIKSAIEYAKGVPNPFHMSSILYQRIIQGLSSTSVMCQKSAVVWTVDNVVDITPRRAPGSLNDLLPYHPFYSPCYFWVSATEEEILKPRPDQPRNLKPLFQITNLPPERKHMILAWLVLAFFPNLGQAALELTGGSLSGKTHAQRILRELIDPNTSIIKRPKGINDIRERIMDAYVPILDDVEELTSKAQIMLSECLDTYTLDLTPKQRKNTLIDITRPLLLNGIDSVVTERALAKKTITIEISDEHNQQRKQPLPTTEQADQLASIFIDILHNVRLVIREWNSPWDPGVEVPYELQDYYHVGYIIGEQNAYHDDDGARVNPFLREIKHHLAQERYRSLQGDCVASAIYTWLQYSTDNEQRNTAETWRKLLRQYSQESCDWPQNAKQLSSRLRKNKKLLNNLGIYLVDHGQSGPNYFWTIGQTTPKDPEDPSHEPD